MVEIIWSEPALSDLDAIADYIALDKPEAARRLVQKVFAPVEQLATRGERPLRLSDLRRRDRRTQSD